MNPELPELADEMVQCPCQCGGSGLLDPAQAATRAAGGIDDLYLMAPPRGDLCGLQPRRPGADHKNPAGTVRRNNPQLSLAQHLGVVEARRLR